MSNPNRTDATILGNLTPGVASALTGLDNNTYQIQMTAPIQPGFELKG